MFDRAAVGRFFAERAPAVDRAELDVRDGLQWLGERELLGVDWDWRDRPPNSGGLMSIGELLSLVAESCMASAFALWSQRMVIEYVNAAVEPDFPRPDVNADGKKIVSIGGRRCQPNLFAQDDRRGPATVRNFCLPFHMVRFIPG